MYTEKIKEVAAKVKKDGVTRVIMHKGYGGRPLATKVKLNEHGGVDLTEHVSHERVTNYAI